MRSACLALIAFGPATLLLAAIYAVSGPQPLPRVQSLAAGGGVLYLPGPLVGREINVDPVPGKSPERFGMFLADDIAVDQHGRRVPVPETIFGDPTAPSTRGAYGFPR